MIRQSWYEIWTGFFVLVIAVGIFSGHGLVVAFGAMGLLAGGISWAWNRLALQDLFYDRITAQQRAFVGEEVTLTLTLTNRKPLPLPWIRVEEEVTEALQVVGGEVAEFGPPQAQTLRHSTSMGWYERIRWDYRLLCTKRGLYALGPAWVESGDPFGFFRTRRRELARHYLTVYPAIFPLDDLGIPASRPLGEVRGGQKLFVDPSRPSGMRDYQAGDPLNTVDWKATARAQRLQVRTYEPSTSTTVILVVAIDATTPYWARHSPEVLERVISTAASVAVYVAEREYTLGLFTNDVPAQRHRPVTVPPARGPDQLNVVLTAIATVRPYPPAPMSLYLSEHGWRFPFGATLVVCTALLPPEFVVTLTDLHRRGRKIVVMYTGEETCPDLPEGIVVHNVLSRAMEQEERLASVAG